MAISTCTKKYKVYKENILIIQDYSERGYNDPCTRAILYNMLEMVKLLDENGCQCYKSFTALRCAVKWGSEDVVSYLLGKYTYSLNIEYITENSDDRKFTLQTEPSFGLTAWIAKLLLDHGADPAKPICSGTNANAIMTAIHRASLEVIARYIRSDGSINSRSWTYTYEIVSPFELSVLLHRPYISAMLLISGCSRGVFNNRKRKFKAELEKLIKEWNMHDNNVTPLQQRCRCVILNHLSPQADLKIEKLQLPPCVIQFLSWITLYISIVNLRNLLEINCYWYSYIANNLAYTIFICVILRYPDI